MIFTSDVKGARDDMADSWLAGILFGNPFIGAAVWVLVLLIIVYIFSQDFAPADFARLGAAMYVIVLIGLFLNNRQLINQMRTKVGGGDMNFTDIDPDIIGSHEGRPIVTGAGPRGGAPATNGASSDEADESDDGHGVDDESETGEPQINSTIADSLIPSMYPTTWLD